MQVHARGAEASATTLASLPLGLSTDIGSTGLPGSTSENDAAYTLTAAEADIGGQADSARFAYAAFAGDGAITARLASRGSTTASGKYGIAMREGLAANARAVSVFFNDGQDHARMAIRSTVGGTTSLHNAAATAQPPMRLRLARADNIFTGSWSIDGQTSMSLGSVTLAMGTTLHVGLIASSRSTTKLNTAVFDQVSGAGWNPPSPLPSITASGSPSAVPATYGQPSSSPTSFSVGGADLLECVNVSAPPGFEVSLSPLGGYAPTLAAGTPGAFGPLTVYLRLAATTAAGQRSGAIELTSPGATPMTLPVAPSTVTPVVLDVIAEAQGKAFGTPDPPLTYAANGLIGTNTLTGALHLVAGESPDSYGINLGTLTAGPNYQISFTGATLTILLPTPFENFATTSGLTAGVNDGHTDDPDHDGITNLAGFAFDGKPLDGARDGKTLSKLDTIGGQQVLTLTLPVRTGAAFLGASSPTSAPIDGITYQIHATTDFQTWDQPVTELTGPDATTLHTTLPALCPGWSYRTFQAATGSPSCFIRASVRAAP